MQEDITGTVGKRFGRWIVMETTESRSRFKCLCDCGTEKVVDVYNLRHGESRSCGCLHKETVRDCLKSLFKAGPDLAGQKFGLWTVLRSTPAHTSGKGVLWECQCNCGTVKKVSRQSLTKGRSRSCGCLQKKVAKQAMTDLRKEGTGDKNPRWKGGVSTSRGYVRVWVPIGHPSRREHSCYVRQHVLVMETILGRRIKPDEKVHHKNGIKNDNRPENLELWTKSHPPGQRISDQMVHAVAILKQYAPETLSGEDISEANKILYGIKNSP